MVRTMISLRFIVVLFTLVIIKVLLLTTLLISLMAIECYLLSYFSAHNNENDNLIINDDVEKSRQSMALKRGFCVAPFNKLKTYYLSILSWWWSWSWSWSWQRFNWKELFSFASALSLFSALVVGEALRCQSYQLFCSKTWPSPLKHSINYFRCFISSDWSSLRHGALL